MDTIVAQATALIAQPIGIIRLSGPKALEIAKIVTQLSTLPARYAQFTKLFDNEQMVDHGIVIYFKAPHSFTGEDVIEIQVHGSVYVINTLIAKAIDLGARMAEPGEFSKRAFLNGKMSLDQVEAVADLIASSSQQAAKSAALSLEGGLKVEVDALQSKLMNLRVLIEAEIDFSEEDIPAISEEGIDKRLEDIDTQFERLLEMCSRGVRLQQGIKIALIGAPNAGKSTLMNAICQKDVSIVTHEAGTTRDIISKDVTYKGICLHFLDTAGIRETDSIAEKAGIDRSYRAMSEADLVLYIKDSTADVQPVTLDNKDMWIIENKVDLLDKPSTAKFAISAKENKGVDNLLDAILSQFQVNDLSETPFSARERHIDVLNRAKAALPSKDLPMEMKAASLQEVQNILSEITGEVTVDDVLGQLFSDFCIGK
jgi:tRNA modification GTPase